MDIMVILGLIGIAALAINIAYFSTLSYDLKQVLYLTERQLIKVNILSKLTFWKKLLPKYLWMLIPILIIIFGIYHKIGELLNCPYCTSWWGGFGFCLSQEMSIIQSIAFGGLTIVFVFLIEIIMNLKEK